MTLTVIKLYKQYNIDGPLGGRCCAKHSTHTRALHPPDHSKRHVTVHPVVRRLGDRALPKMWNFHLIRDTGFKSSCSGSTCHYVQCKCDPLQIWENNSSPTSVTFSNTYSFSLYGKLPNVDDGELYLLFLILIFTVISDLKMCMFSSAGILTGEQTLANYYYVLILIWHLCPTNPMG